jgi:hypothetical protein
LPFQFGIDGLREEHEEGGTLPDDDRDIGPFEDECQQPRVRFRTRYRAVKAHAGLP